MEPRRSKRKPTFFWQGLLIVLPVVVLAALGGVSLRQDRLLAQHEAAERAQAIVDDLLPKIEAELSAGPDTGPASEPVFRVDASGRLVEPPPYAPVPVPQALDPGALNAEQARLWLAARQEEAGAENAPKAAAAYQDFLRSSPPAALAAPAQYALALLLLKQGQRDAARDRFRQLVETYPEAPGESGLPLRPFAQLKLLELATRTNPPAPQQLLASLNGFCSNAVFAPSFLTPRLLELAEERAAARQEKEAIAAWQRLWRGHELSRQLFAAASPQLEDPAAVPRLFWLEDHSWLAVRAAGGGPGARFVCRPESEIVSRVAALIERSKQVPAYLGIGVEVAGREVAWGAAGGPGRGTGRAVGQGRGGVRPRLPAEGAPSLLAWAAAAGAGAERIRVNAYLADAALLFARQRARTVWFGSLIGVAAVAALIGLAAAHRAFRRQLQLSELKSNFVSSVSHELRAPISSVRLLAESLERGKVPEASKQQEYFRFMVQECRRLSALVENVLDFSRIEQGRKEYDFEPTDLVALARQTVKLMESYAAERQVTIALTIPEPEAAALTSEPVVDGKAIQQALVNLLDNAIKHSPKGETVTVGLEVDAAKEGAAGAARFAAPDSSAPRPAAGLLRPGTGGLRLRLWVEDHGPGIPAEEHAKIFERFYRLGSELRRETQGVGIGLSIVKHVVEAHQGRVVVRSAPGRGSRFTICLPGRGT